MAYALYKLKTTGRRRHFKTDEERQQAIKENRDRYRSQFSGQGWQSLGILDRDEPPPEQVLIDRARRKELAAPRFGDPLPGYSALNQPKASPYEVTGEATCQRLQATLGIGLTPGWRRHRGMTHVPVTLPRIRFMEGQWPSETAPTVE